MRYSKITGWGKCLPPAVLSNADLETVTDTSDEWITTRTGIKERRVSHVNTSQLAQVAAERALAAAGLKASDLDMIILATCTPDAMIPSAATTLQDRLGVPGVPAMDINAACTGFIYGLSMAHSMVVAGTAERVLVAGAEKLTNWLNFTDRSTAVLFGDGAGAVVVEGTDEPGGVRSVVLGSDGSLGEILCVPDTGSGGTLKAVRKPWVQMQGPEVFRKAVVAMGDAATEAVAQAGISVEDVDLLIPHQANVRIIDATARRLKLAPEQVFINIASYGNTSAATIPIALTEALAEQRIHPGDTLVFAAFGGGLTWGAAVIQWGDRVEPIEVSDAALPPSDRSALDLLQPNVELFGSGIA